MSTEQSDTNSIASTESVMAQYEQQFANLNKSLVGFRSQITALQQQLRTIEKSVRKEMNGLKKQADKSKNRGNRKPSGFATPSKISKELCDFMGKHEGSEVARTEVTKFVIAYIKENGLAVSKAIKPDDKLKALLGTKEEDEITYFNIQRFMNQHFMNSKKKSKKKMEEAVEAAAEALA